MAKGNLKKKFKIIKTLLIVIIILSLGFGYYHSRYIAPINYQTKKYTITHTSIPESFTGFKIGYISDLHIKSSEDIQRLQDIVNTLNKKECDMVIFGGDLYNSELFDIDKVVAILKGITSTSGKFAVLGEKDLATVNETSSILMESGFEILHNEYRKIYFKDSYISFFGLEANGDISSLINDENRDTYKLVSVHQPDYFDQTKEFSHLQLSGHSLGGYINIPFIGGILKKDNASKYINGKYTAGVSTLLISNGLGNESSFEYRFNCPNQIVVVTLEHKK